jgi:hypothetical protein
MRNRLGMSLALTVILSLGGMTLAKTPRAAQPQNTNTSGTMSGTATGRSTHKRHRASHRRRRHGRTHHKAAAATNANR